MLDLKQFCSRTRPHLMEPFSVGEWSYATDGRIIVRVPRRDDCPLAGEDNKDAGAAEALFATFPSTGFVAMPVVSIEADEDDICDGCDGRGTEHDCPSCQCQCLDCRGTGHPIPGYDTSVDIGGTVYCAENILQLQALPNVELCAPSLEIKSTDMKGSFFRFEGGEGALMPRRGQRAVHIIAPPPRHKGEPR